MENEKITVLYISVWFYYKDDCDEASCHHLCALHFSMVLL